MKINMYSGFLRGLAIFVFFLTAFSSTAFAQWSMPQTIYQGTASPEPGPFWISPVIVTQKDPSGVIHLVWTNKVTDERNVLAHATFSNGQWSQMEVLPSDVNTSVMLPSLEITPDGRLHVSYTAFLPDGTWGVMYTSKPTGGQWSAPSLVSSTENLFNAYAQLICDAQQMPHVIYVAFAMDGESTMLKHVKFSADNPSQAEQLSVPADAQGGFNPRVVKSQDGTINCFWYKNTDEGSSVMYASFGGSSWSATTTLATPATTSVMDESPIVAVSTPSDELYALWYSMQQGEAMYKHFTPGQGWGMLEQASDGAFVMASGISDSQNNLHIAGNLNDEENEIYDMKYHFLSGGQWIHELIEQATAVELPSFPALIISGDTLYCFYARLYPEGGGELAMSWKILDFLTPVSHLPVNKDIALKVSPNPLESSSVVSFTTKGRGEVKFILTDALGRTEYATMPVQDAGNNTVNLNSIFTQPRQRGIYILKIVTSSGTDTVTLVN